MFHNKAWRQPKDDIPSEEDDEKNDVYPEPYLHDQEEIPNAIIESPQHNESDQDKISNTSATTDMPATSDSTSRTTTPDITSTTDSFDTFDSFNISARTDKTSTSYTAYTSKEGFSMEQWDDEIYNAQKEQAKKVAKYAEDEHYVYQEQNSLVPTKTDTTAEEIQQTEHDRKVNLKTIWTPQRTDIPSVAKYAEDYIEIFDQFDTIVSQQQHCIVHKKMTDEEFSSSNTSSSTQSPLRIKKLENVKAPYKNLPPSSLTLPLPLPHLQHEITSNIKNKPCQNEHTIPTSVTMPEFVSLNTFPIMRPPFSSTQSAQRIKKLENVKAPYKNLPPSSLTLPLPLPHLKDGITSNIQKKTCQNENVKAPYKNQYLPPCQQQFVPIQNVFVPNNQNQHVHNINENLQYNIIPYVSTFGNNLNIQNQHVLSIPNQHTIICWLFCRDSHNTQQEIRTAEIFRSSQTSFRIRKQYANLYRVPSVAPIYTKVEGVPHHPVWLFPTMIVPTNSPNLINPPPNQIVMWIKE